METHTDSGRSVPERRWHGKEKCGDGLSRAPFGPSCRPLIGSRLDKHRHKPSARASSQFRPERKWKSAALKESLSS
ncbi:hypothetical protein SKAU_G00122160 [Synaphobranchus kaupii]|uniref:Uncharacterized protein n=1 Tax=Synaphobranchus kaupii TaxID=118154 RepID=A0A9Q1FNS7_SYNKA|nr:hypothetical protein SKAU_G00122160 [Synaphobranchus kaupii]